MLIDANQLRDITVNVARAQFGQRIFARREIMNAVERELRRRQIWETEDDVDSKSADPKSKGLARIDYAISELKRRGGLLNVGRDRWKVPLG